MFVQQTDWLLPGLTRQTPIATIILFHRIKIREYTKTIHGNRNMIPKWIYEVMAEERCKTYGLPKPVKKFEKVDMNAFDLEMCPRCGMSLRNKIAHSKWCQVKTKVIVQVYQDNDVSDACRLTFEVWFHKWTDSLPDIELVNLDVERAKPCMWAAWKASWMIKHQMGVVV
jgi:hypothetical protein